MTIENLRAPLDITVSIHAADVWIRVRGEVDLSNRDQVLQSLLAVPLTGTDTVNLDLELLTFCDIGGCRVLSLLVREARRSGHETRIHGATPTLRKMMRLLSPNLNATFVDVSP